MKEWLGRVQESLDMALQAVGNSDIIPNENMYKLATVFYSQINNMNNEQLLNEMADAIEAQYEEDCSHDENSKYQYKFHYVSSYLYCYVVAGKVDEMKYDRIMDYVNSRLSLFEERYE